MTTPEEKAREKIDYQLNEAGWIVQNRDEINLAANDGVIIREFPLIGGEGFADYMIFVDGVPVGALEAKPEGYPVRSVEIQTDKYAATPNDIEKRCDVATTKLKWFLEGNMSDSMPTAPLSERATITMGQSPDSADINSLSFVPVCIYMHP